MHTLTWSHTRKRTPMVLRGAWAQLMLQVMMIRHVHPSHPMQMDGKPI